MTRVGLVMLPFLVNPPLLVILERGTQPLAGAGAGAACLVPVLSRAHMYMSCVPSICEPS